MTTYDLARAWASENTTAVGHIISADGISWRYTGEGVALPDMPGWVPHGQATLLHWGAKGEAITSRKSLPTPTVNDGARIRYAFNYCLPRGLDLHGDPSRAYGANGVLVWGARAVGLADEVIPLGSPTLDHFRWVWIGAAGTPTAKTGADPADWNYRPAKFFVGSGPDGGDAGKHSVVLGDDCVFDGRWVCNPLHFVGAKNKRHGGEVRHGLDYEVMVGTGTGAGALSCTDAEIGTKALHYLYGEQSDGSTGTSAENDGTGWWGVEGRTSVGTVVTGSDVKITSTGSTGRHCVVIGESFNVEIAGAKFWSGEPQTQGVVTAIISAKASNWTWRGGHIQDGRLQIMGDQGLMQGVTFNQYLHGAVEFVATEPNETFKRLTFTGNRTGENGPAVVLGSIGSGTWGEFSGTFHSNTIADGSALKVAGKAYYHG